MKRRSFIQSLLITSGSIMIGSATTFGNKADENALKVSMIYNNIGKDENLINQWGLSILMESKDESLLFDTGGDPKVLLQNINILEIDINKISNVVISHNHLDHLKGISGILEKSTNNPKVYVPNQVLEDIRRSFPESNLFGVDQSIQINKFAWSTGQLNGNQSIYEQSLIVKLDNSIYLFTGCSHPGIVHIVEKTIRLFPEEDIKLIAGGFHMMNHSEMQIYNISDKLKNLSVEKIAPSHCTGNTALGIFQDEWENDFINFDLSTNRIGI